MKNVTSWPTSKVFIICILLNDVLAHFEGLHEIPVFMLLFHFHKVNLLLWYGATVPPFLDMTVLAL